MHYYIDGYNCLFCSEGIHNNLHIQRTRFLEHLRTYVQALNLSVTIVFDSTVQAESTRSHLSPLECIYTNRYETADHYLLSLIQHSRFPSRITLVTSDNALATAARHEGAQTVEAQPFLNWLTQRYAKVKHKQQTRMKMIVPAKKVETKVQKDPVPVPALIHPNTMNVPPKESKENLLHVFEERYRALCEEEDEEPHQRGHVKHKSNPVSHQNKQKRDTFYTSHVPPPKLPLESETARWQRLFEQKHVEQDSKENL